MNPKTPQTTCQSACHSADASPNGSLVVHHRNAGPCGLPSAPLRVHDLVVQRDELRQRAMGQYSAYDVQTILSGTCSRKYRDRVVPVALLVMLMLLFVLDKVDTFSGLWRKLMRGDCRGLPAIDVTESALYKRLKAVSHELFLDLLRTTTRSLTNSPLRRSWVKDLAPFATRILAIDDTTLDALARKTKWLKGFEKGAPETLGGRLGCALDLETGCFAGVLYDSDSAANEKNHLWPLLKGLGVGSIYVFDLGYFSFAIFDGLTNRFCYFVSRLRKKASFVTVQTLAETHTYRDRIVYLGKHRADRAAHPVRLVELLIGTTWYSYVTNVLDPAMLPADRLWALYGQRWTIEMAFAALKRALGMGFLRICHQNGMLIQIWSTFIVFQVLAHLRLEIAAKHGWDEDKISWLRLMRGVGSYLQRPRPGQSLRQWILQEAPTLDLQKRGVRKRRETSLPQTVLDQIVASKPPPIDTTIPARTARQGKPKPRTKVSVIIEGRLN